MESVPLRLLVIEDAPEDAELLQVELRRAGYLVTMERVEDINAMSHALDEDDWDLVVSDHSMPGMTSFDALEILRRRELDLPFIIVSGGIGEEEAVAAMRAGAKDYVMKGNVARLIPAIARELKQAEARRERRRGETAIRELEQKRDYALESAHIGEWEMDIATRAFHPFPRHYRLFGHDEAPARWNYDRALERVFADDRPLVEEAFRAALESDAELDLEFRVIWPDKKIHWLWLRGRRFEPEGRAPLLAGIIANISQRKETEAQLHQALKMEAIGQLTGGIAHDFNNLLTVILGNTGLLRDALRENAELLELANGVQDAGRSGAELTRRLLAFARQQPLQAKEIDLGARLTEAMPLFRQPLGPEIELAIDIAPDLPPVAIDPNQLATAVLNLVINARDAMPKGGGISISARKVVKEHATDYPGTFVRLEIADTGTGMPPDVAARAIEPFFTTKEVGKGTGLGLSMVYGFVRQSGGQMALDTAPGRGTTVRICLPGVIAPNRPAAPAKRAAMPKAVRATTVLVVDDDRAVRGFLVAVCRGLKHRVIEASSGAEALAALALAPEIELLLSDVAMPGGMSGYELARDARRRRPKLKIMLTSGFPAKDLARRAEAELEPEVTILQKPYDAGELAGHIADVLGADEHG
jgi:two-component system, cell cycle sensor histidine kinase and response regulator CckA